MKRFFASIVSLLLFAGGGVSLVPAQTAQDPNAGTKLEWDNTNSIWRYKWWAKTGSTYFIQHSEDLQTWTWVPVVEPGTDAIKEWGFTSTGNKFFLRLRYTDSVTSSPENGDFDGDGVSNLAEVQQGTDPFKNVDSDNDGLSDDAEIALGFNPNDAYSQDPSHTKNDGSIDSGGGGIPNSWMARYYGADRSNWPDPGSDNDHDNLSNRDEYEFGGDPTKADTDADGVLDGEDAVVYDPVFKHPRTAKMQYALVDLGENFTATHLNNNNAVLLESNPLPLVAISTPPYLGYAPREVKMWKNGQLTSWQIPATVDGSSHYISGFNDQDIAVGGARYTNLPNGLYGLVSYGELPYKWSAQSGLEYLDPHFVNQLNGSPIVESVVYNSFSSWLGNFLIDQTNVIYGATSLNARRQSDSPGSFPGYLAASVKWNGQSFPTATGTAYQRIINSQSQVSEQAGSLELIDALSPLGVKVERRMSLAPYPASSPFYGYGMEFGYQSTQIAGAVLPPPAQFQPWIEDINDMGAAFAVGHFSKYSGPALPPNQQALADTVNLGAYVKTGQQWQQTWLYGSPEDKIQGHPLKGSPGQNSFYWSNGQFFKSLDYNTNDRASINFWQDRLKTNNLGQVLAMTSYNYEFQGQTYAGPKQVLWQNGKAYDLNSLVAVTQGDLAQWSTLLGYDLNDKGVMVGSALKIREDNGNPIPSGNQKNHAVMLLPVELKLLSETQNKANQIYNPTRKDDPWGATYGGGTNDQNGAPRNKLFMVTEPQGGKYKVTLEVEIPETFRTKFYAAAYVGDTKVANSDKVFDADGKCELEFEHLGTANDIEDFAIRIGYDANNSSTLDPGEITKLQVKSYGELIVRGTKASKYGSAKSNIDGIISGSLTSLGTDLILPNAKRFLQIFRDGDAAGVPTDRQPTSSTAMSFNAFNGYFCEWLTHNSGAPFSEEGVSTITEYTWNQNTPAAEIIATSLQVQGEVRNFYIASVNSQAETFFAGKPVGTVAYFPSSTGFYDVPHLQKSPSWVAPTTVTFHNFPEYMAMGDDVNGTIGRGRLLSHQARYKVEKQLVYYNPPDGSPTSSEELVITQVISQGEVSDLYDFNDLVGGAGQDAALLQIGFGKGAYGSDRNRGKIYRDKIEFNKTYPNLPTFLP